MLALKRLEVSVTGSALGGQLWAARPQSASEVSMLVRRAVPGEPRALV